MQLFSCLQCKILNNEEVFIHPTSVLFSRKPAPECVIYEEIVMTTKKYFLNIYCSSPYVLFFFFCKDIFVQLQKSTFFGFQVIFFFSSRFYDLISDIYPLFSRACTINLWVICILQKKNSPFSFFSSLLYSFFDLKRYNMAFMQYHKKWGKRDRKKKPITSCACTRYILLSFFFVLNGRLMNCGTQCKKEIEAFRKVKPIRFWQILGGLYALLCYSRLLSKRLANSISGRFLQRFVSSHVRVHSQSELASCGYAFSEAKDSLESAVSNAVDQLRFHFICYSL